MIAGLEKLTAGQTTQDSQEVTHLNSKVKMMFQDDRLLSWPQHYATFLVV